MSSSGDEKRPKIPITGVGFTNKAGADKLFKSAVAAVAAAATVSKPTASIRPKRLTLPKSTYQAGLGSLMGAGAFKDKRIVVAPGLVGSALQWFRHNIGDKGTIILLETDDVLCDLLSKKITKYGDEIKKRISIERKTFKQFCADHKMQAVCDILYLEPPWENKDSGDKRLYLDDGDNKVVLGDALRECTVDKIVVCARADCDLDSTLGVALKGNGGYEYGTSEHAFQPAMVEGPRTTQSDSASFCFLRRRSPTANAISSSSSSQPNK